MSQEEVTRVKKSILMRYPLSFLEEVSRALIGYRSWLDNKAIYKGIPILDTLIDYVTLDPMTGKRVYDLSEEERKAGGRNFIVLPKHLVERFQELYNGPRKDGKISLRYLSPGNTLDAKRGYVKIRGLVNFTKAWISQDAAAIIMRGGFYYKKTEYEPTPFGMMPVERLIRTIDFEDPNLQYYLTNTIPFSYWSWLYEKGWVELKPVCTMIERIIAETLESAGYSPLSSSHAQDISEEEDPDSLAL